MDELRTVATQERQLNINRFNSEQVFGSACEVVSSYRIGSISRVFGYGLNHSILIGISKLEDRFSLAI